MKNELILPELSLVLMMGASASGKTTFARKHFKEVEILTSDYYRALVGEDENDQTVTSEAFDLLRYVAGIRLKLGRFTIVDATNLHPEDRRVLIDLAREHHCLPAVIVMNMPKQVCLQRNRSRSDRNLPDHTLQAHLGMVRRSIRGLKREGFRHIHVLNSVAEADTVVVKRQPMWTDRKDDHGPFDIIGDVHGCFIETMELLQKLGYTVEQADGFYFGRGYRVRHPAGRKLIFLGDLVDRGPGIGEVLRLVMSLVESNTGLCVPGNHEVRLVRKLRGRDVQLKFGLAESLAQLEQEGDVFKKQAESFMDKLVGHYVLAGGKLVVAHAGMKEAYQGRGSGTVRSFGLFGETSGETDEFGLPIRYNWAADYRGKAMVVYGHTPEPRSQWLNNTINIDTGCVFGGNLTALRYPEREIVSVPAKREYTPSSKPFKQTGNADELSLQQQYDDLLDLQDVTGKMHLNTRLRPSIIIKEEYAAAALEAMSRFAVNPRWLIYLPPTMSPTETSFREDYLEHPEDVFNYYAGQGVNQVVCEEKHMGSRAVVIVCRDETAAKRRFAIEDGSIGICYTRTGRAFFNDRQLEQDLLVRVRDAVGNAGLFESLDSDWFCLDCELMPWSLKAQEMLKNQYAGVGSSASAALTESVKSLEAASARGMEVTELLRSTRDRLDTAHQFITAYRQYCWPVESLAQVKLAPFHIMAGEGRVYTDRNHKWHMETISKLCEYDPSLLRRTETRIIELADQKQVQSSIDWWLAMTAKGGEGMVVKPLDFICRDEKELLQPAVKCRGREYLRINYGPEYTRHIDRLRRRGLAAKRSLALREFALGIESLERFVNKEPLRRVHECVFAVLALESQPVDPRL